MVYIYFGSLATMFLAMCFMAWKMFRMAKQIDLQSEYSSLSYKALNKVETLEINFPELFDHYVKPSLATHFYNFVTNGYQFKDQPSQPPLQIVRTPLPDMRGERF